MTKPNQFDRKAAQTDPTAALDSTLDGLAAGLDRVIESIADAGDNLDVGIDMLAETLAGPPAATGPARYDPTDLDGLGGAADLHRGEPEYNPDGSRRTFLPGNPPTLRRRRSPKKTLRRMIRERAAAKQIERLPTAAEELLLILTGAWHGFDIVGAILHLADRPCRHLRLATLGFNIRQARRLAELLDAGQVQNCTMLVSEVFQAKNTAEFGLLHTLLTDRGQVVRAGRNHAKLMLFDFDARTKYACHGSLNLRSCVAFEQMAICKDTPTHDFFADYIDTIGGRT